MSVAKGRSIIAMGAITGTSALKELTKGVEKWRNRDLSQEKIKYIFVDGVIFKMRLKWSVENIPVLAAIGVTEDGTKLVLGLQSGDKESATNWRGVFRGLKRRGGQGGE